MVSHQDEVNVRLIEDLTPRLREKIEVERVLDHLDLIEDDERERIRQKARNDGNLAAVDLLISAIIKKPHRPGWFTAFVDALWNSGLRYAAEFIQQSQTPEEEVENDYCVKLIRILAPSLVEMQTKDVCLLCFSNGLLNVDDKERIEAEIHNAGSRSGARILLRAIVRSDSRWFSTFLSVLRDTGHKDLYELTGGPSDCDSKGCDEKKCSFKDEPTGSEVAMESPAAAAAADESSSVEYMDISTNENPQDEDLYEGASVESKQESNCMDLSPPAGSDSEAATRGQEPAHIVLRDYQAEVAQPALEGENIIICLPTGHGKTRAAVYITKTHLDRRRAEGPPGKVVVLVNKVPLVEQHYTSEFLPFLKPRYKVERVSGDCQLKISFTETVKRNDVIICTAQILENYLERSNSEEDEGVSLSDLSLIVIDECHHTQKGGVYNHIMMRYLKQKHRNMKLRKEGQDPVPLPQILGLTASPGVGEAKTTEQAKTQILRICANLDASKIMTGGLEDFRKDQRTKIVRVEDRTQDPFGQVIKKIMNAIHDHADLSPTCDLGSQNYEQWVVKLERTAATEENHRVRVCAEHLRQYNEGLNLSNTIRMRDSFSFLDKYQEEALRKKSPEGDVIIQITDTERFLFNLFRENKEELQRLADMPEYENDSLSKLRSNILQEFSTRESARGILFTKTRRSALALTQWIRENPKFSDIGVKASYIIGGGDQSVVKPMTSAEQKDVLSRFSSGEVNLLIATSVAEEGLDIPACNIVIQYGQLTNEIAMIQARGRGRAKDSSYIVIEVKGSGVTEKECVNEFRIELMYKAINKIRALAPEEYNNTIKEFQLQSILENKVKTKKKQQKGVKNVSPSDVKFSCRSCPTPVCTGKDIQVIENVHNVNMTPEFKELFNQTENTSLQERLLDYETNSYISCKKCGQRWGSMMFYKGIDCPCLLVKNFVVTVNGKKIPKCTRWKELPVKFSPFDYVEHANQVASSSDDED